MEEGKKDALSKLLTAHKARFGSIRFPESLAPPSKFA